MLKMVAGEPPKQVLVLGLSFGNLDKFKAEPRDTYIRVKRQETGLSADVILYSGDSHRAFGTEKLTNTSVFMVGLDMEQIDKLRQNPGKSVIHLDNEIYKVGFNVMIFSGETEASMAEEVQELIGPDTSVTTAERLKN
jgi:hypothetical protein